MALRNTKVSYFIPADEVLQDKRTTAFLKALKLRIKCARFTDKNLRNCKLKDVGLVRTQKGWQVNLYFDTSESNPPL